MSLLLPFYILFMALTKELIAWKLSPPNQGVGSPIEGAPLLFPSLLLKTHAVILGLLAFLLMLFGSSQNDETDAGDGKIKSPLH